MTLVSEVRAWIRLDRVLIGALPFVLLAISPDRVRFSFLVAVVYVAGALIARRWTSADRPVVIYAVVAAGFTLLSLLRVETITAESAAAQHYAAAKAFYFVAVLLPIALAVASLVRRMDDIRPAAVAVVGVGIGIAVMTVALRSAALLGETRYTIQGNLAALGALLLFQFWIIRKFWLGVGLGFLAILATGISDSRQSAMALAIGLAATALYWLLADRLARRGRSLVRLWVVPLVLVLVGSVTLAGLSAISYRQAHGLPVPSFLPNLWRCDCLPARVVVLFSQQGGRDVLLVKGWDLFLHHPIVGAGLGSYLDTHAPYRYPHNIELEIAAELGLVGLVALLGPLVWAWARLIAVGIRARSQAVASVMAILLVYVVVANLSGDVPSARGFWIFGILAFKFGIDGLSKERSLLTEATPITSQSSKLTNAQRPIQASHGAADSGKAVPAQVVGLEGVRRVMLPAGS